MILCCSALRVPYLYYNLLRSEVLVKRILLVDDEKMFFKPIKLYLDGKLKGTEIISAHDGIEAWGDFQEIHPSLVITDFVMPGWNGLDLAKRIRAKSRKTPIILMTGYIDDIDVDLSLLVDEVVLKPFDVDSLTSVIKKYLNN